MDYMDIDQLSEVPDTPDRLQDSSFANSCTKNESNPYMNNNIASMDCFDEGNRSRSREKSKLVTHSGNRRLFFRSQNTSRPTLSASGESFSDSNPLRYGKMTENKYAEYQNKHSSHSQATEKGKSVCSSHSQWPACKEGKTVVDLTEQDGRGQVFEKVISNRAPRSDEFRKGSLSINIPPLRSTADCSTKISRKSSQVQEKGEYASKCGSSFDRGKGVELIVDDPPRAGNTASLHPSTSSKVTRQKRLVQNGCISPLNIAKTKQSVDSHNLRTVAKEGQCGSGIAASDIQSPSAVNIRELVAEGKDVHRFKGKGVPHYPFPSEEIDLRSMHLPRRSSVTIKEPSVSADASEGASRCIEGLDGWRTTRNRTKKVGPFVADEDSHISRATDDSCFINQQNNNELSRRDHRNGRNARLPRNVNDVLDDWDPLSCQNVSAPSHMLSQRGQMLGQFNEHPQTANTFIKRQRQSSVSSAVAECSTSAFRDPEIEFLSPPVVPSSSRSTRNRDLHGTGGWNSVIEVDDFSPLVRNNSGSNALRSSSEDSGVRARQVEADEMLARKLQEQLYNELPGVGIGEIDERLALAMQQEESFQNTFPTGAPHVHPLSGSSRANLLQQSRLQPSQGPPIRSSMPGRVHASTRMARLRGRGRFPGRPLTLSYSSRNSMFPASMDVDTRMHILEALEAFSDMGVPNEMLQVDRDFNEGDYEMLLALDDNNHQHGGASHAQINGLPQSTVQKDNLEECSVCLETPTLGQTIRHLPCLHKFHKDCIDPWLRRRSSCPVCKSSIT